MKNQKYQSIFETTLDGIIVINARGIVEDINTAGLGLFGHSKEDVVGQNIKILMPEPHHSAHDGYISNYQNTRVPKIIGIGRDVDGLKKNGEVFPFRLAVSEFEVEGKQFFTGIIHDLSERKLQEKIIRGYAEELEQRVEKRTQELQEEIELREVAQKALIASQRLYETIAKNYPNGIISVIDRDYFTQFAEGRELGKLKLKPDALIGESFFNRFDEHKLLIKDNIDLVFDGNEKQFEYGNDQFTYRVRCVPLYSDQKIDQVLIVENNITAEKNAELDMQKALGKERQLNELKTNFVSMASHEFRTPLSSILSSAELVGKYEETSQQENRVKHLNKIRVNVQNLTMILNDFLSLERIEGGYLKHNPEVLNVKYLLASIIEESEPILKKNQHLLLQEVDENLERKVDSFLFRNILINLISNAVKYSDKDIKISATIKDEDLCVSIEDQGIGISTEDQKSLFNRFYRASNAGQIQGTGLGLNIVKRYAEIMQAKIEFTSELNKGSTFTLLI